jgi:hypothetical protein
MFVRHGSSRQQGQPLYPLVAPVSSPNLDLCVKADFGRFLVDNPSSREQRRVPQQTTTQVAMHPAPAQRAGPSVPASDLGPSPGLRSPENLSAPYPPAPPIRHSSDSLPAGKPVRWVGRETGSASTPRPRATSRRADPAVAPVSASAMPLRAPVRQEGRRRHLQPLHKGVALSRNRLLLSGLAGERRFRRKLTCRTLRECALWPPSRRCWSARLHAEDFFDK